MFGYGRSPTSLKWYLNNEVRDKLGLDAAARRQAFKTAAPSVALFERMKSYMKLVAETNRDPVLYEYPLSIWISKWHNLLADFHANLNQSYQAYLEQQQKPTPGFTRQSIEVLDLQDPHNYQLLTDYNAFHETYTFSATPVILGNVRMTKHNYTLDYLVEQCGNVDLTAKVKVSPKVG